MSPRTVAFVGAAGGVGTTRLTVECGATLARTGRNVGIFDSAFHTQGLRDYPDSTGTRDATALATGEATLAETLAMCTPSLSGELALCPATATTNQLTQATSPDAAERFATTIAGASLSRDAVFIDVSPTITPVSRAMLKIADLIVLVTTETPRGARALSRHQQRLRELGHPADCVLFNHADESPPDAIAVPTSTQSDPYDCPTCATPGSDESFARAVTGAVESLFGISIQQSEPSSGLVGRLLSRN